MAGRDRDFDEFAHAAWPRLHRSAYLLTGDQQLAEDLAQTALERTYAKWRTVRRDDALAYARRIVVNLNVDRLRRRRLTEVGGDALSHAEDGAAHTNADTNAHSIAHDRDQVVRLLAGLTDKERRVVVLRHYYDLPEVVVAHELGIAPGTVKSTLSRALAKLRVRVEEPVHEESIR
jgi:RNA polymerase sigma-70 factor (sigma-E family)